MPDTLTKQIQKFLAEMQIDVFEERVIRYIIREVHFGRKISDIVKDPYVENRVEKEHLAKLLEDPEVVKSVEQELEKAFKQKDFKFSE